MDISRIPPALQRCEGYCQLKMWDAAWEELEALPSELQLDLSVLHWRIQIQMGMGEYEKASYVGLSLVQKFPEKLGILLSTAECLIHCKDFQGASRLLRNGLSNLSESADLWLTLARVEALLGDTEAARDCVNRYVSLNPDGQADLLSITELGALW